MSSQPDNVNDMTLHTLSTDELLDLHRTRKERYEHVLSMLVMRAVSAVTIEEENDRLARLLRECSTVLETAGADKGLLERIEDALEEHDASE